MAGVHGQLKRVPMARPSGAHFNPTAAMSMYEQFGKRIAPEVFGLSPTATARNLKPLSDQEVPTSNVARLKAAQSILTDLSAIVQRHQDKVGLDELYKEFVGEASDTVDAEWMPEDVDKLQQDASGLGPSAAGSLLGALLALGPTLAARALLSAFAPGSEVFLHEASIGAALSAAAGSLTESAVVSGLTHAYDIASKSVDLLFPETATAISQGGIAAPMWAGNGRQPESEATDKASTDLYDRIDRRRKSYDKMYTEWLKGLPTATALRVEELLKSGKSKAEVGRLVPAFAAFNANTDSTLDRLSETADRRRVAAQLAKDTNEKGLSKSSAVQPNPMAGPGTTPLFPGGDEPANFHNGPSHISSYMDTYGAGMHVEGSQLMCIIRNYPAQVEYQVLEAIADGCQIDGSPYLALKGIPVNPLLFGFLLGELANNFAQFRINHLEICISTRVGMSTTGQYVMGYHSDGALSVTQPGGAVLTPAIVDSFDKSRMMQPYSNCGADGNAMGAGCWTMPRESGPNASHWFYIEPARPGSTDVAELRQCFDGYICFANIDTPIGGADERWATVGCRYSVDFRSPAYDTTASAVFRNARNMLGPLSDEFWQLMKDNRILLCVAWLLGLRFIEQGSPEDLAGLLENLQLLGIVDPGATVQTLLPPLYSYLLEHKDAPGMITPGGWIPLAHPSCPVTVPHRGSSLAQLCAKIPNRK